MPTSPEFVVVAGVRLRFIDVGPTAVDEPDDTILIVPGHTAKIEGFDDLVPPLAERHRVLVLDLPGSGYSDHPDRKYTLTYYEDMIARFLDELGVAKCVPVGGSLGGNLVLRLGHRWPDRFERLVLWAPGGAWKAKRPLAAVVRAVCGRRLFWPSVRIQSRFWYSPDFPGREAALEETFAYYRDVMSPGFVAMYWGIAADQLAHSLFDIAPGIAQPTLLMWGDQDNGANMGAGVARLHALLPNNELVVFGGARHSLEAEIPGALAATITEFLARLAPPNFYAVTDAPAIPATALETSPPGTKPERSAADQFMRRLMFVPEGPAVRDVESAQRMFSQSIAISAARCLLTYIFLPIVAPIIGAKTGVGPAAGIVLGVVALNFDVLTVRRFWLSDHRYRWLCTGIYAVVLAFLLFLLAHDVSEVLS